MKVLVFVKATPSSEQGLKPSPELTKMVVDMGKFNEQLIKAGIMQEADGLKPSSAGKRIKISDSGATTVIDGPFVETKELVAGYWVWNVKSMDEAVEWARRCPNPMPGNEGVLEIRPTNTLEDFEGLLPKDEVAREVLRRERITRPAGKKAGKRTAKRLAERTPKRRPARAKSKK